MAGEVCRCLQVEEAAGKLDVIALRQGLAAPPLGTAPLNEVKISSLNLSYCKQDHRLHSAPQNPTAR